MFRTTTCPNCGTRMGEPMAACPKCGRALPYPAWVRVLARAAIVAAAAAVVLPIGARLFAPKSEEQIQLEIRTWMFSASKHETGGDPAGAIRLYRTVVEDHPGSPEAKAAADAIKRLEGGGR
jgi:hypothetical protein